jgi:hypothetical protein
MASLEILLISVRSDTPTSFFLVLSKTALDANCDLGCPGRAAPPAAAASFLRPARLVTAYSALCQCLVSWWAAWAECTMADARPRAPACCESARLAVVRALEAVGARRMGSQAQCVERGRAALLRKYGESHAHQSTNDVTAHVGRIGSWSEYGSPHSHTLVTCITQVTRKLRRRICPSTSYKSAQDILCMCALRGPLRQQQNQHQAPNCHDRVRYSLRKRYATNTINAPSQPDLSKTQQLSLQPTTSSTKTETPPKCLCQ